MLEPLSCGVEVAVVLTVGDAVRGNAGPYRLAGIPDGLAVLAHPDGTASLFVNHELQARQGARRAHGARGAFVSRWTLAPDGRVVHGEDLIRRVLFPGPEGWREHTTAFERFCSADLPPPGALTYAGLGTRARLLLTGEETTARWNPKRRYGRAFAQVVTGPLAGTSYALPRLGRLAFENVLLNPHPGPLTIAMLPDDADAAPNFSTGPLLHLKPPSELYVYVGTKQAHGNPVERAGLTNGRLYGLRVPGLRAEDPEHGLGRDGYRRRARFELVSFGDVSDDETGKTLQKHSVERGVMQFRRLEDGAWDTREPAVFWVVTTDRPGGHSRLWRLRFDDLGAPWRGGAIEIALEGRAHGIEMMDNLTVDPWGRLLIQEDPPGDRLARIWLFDPDTGRVQAVARAHPAWFDPRAEPLTTDEETTGIVPAFDVLGDGGYFLAVQAHAPTGEPDTVEHGQILRLHVPRSLRARCNDPGA